MEPQTQEVRETTRVALREVRPSRTERVRLRRVAGYEMLGREVPWNWDCVSSVTSGGVVGGSRRSGSGRKAHILRHYPPFESIDRWM